MKVFKRIAIAVLIVIGMVVFVIGVVLLNSQLGRLLGAYWGVLPAGVIFCSYVGIVYFALGYEESRSKIVAKMKRGRENKK